MKFVPQVYQKFSLSCFRPKIDKTRIEMKYKNWLQDTKIGDFAKQKPVKGIFMA